MLSFKRLFPVAALAATLTLAAPLQAAPGEKYPQTKTRLLKGRETRKLENEQAQYAINEIYARHGLLFGDMKLRKQFLRFKWYRPEPGLSAEDARKRFNSYEKRNVERLALARESEIGAEQDDYVSPYKTGSQGLVGERFPETRLDKYFGIEIESMSEAQLQYALNEIYARHGFNFDDMDLRKHFLKLGWYKPKPDLSRQQVAATFSNIERPIANALAEQLDWRRN